MASTQIVDLTNAEWFQERIKKAVQAEIDALVQHEAQLAADRILKQVPAIAAKIGLEMQSMIHYDRAGADLRITIVRKD